jgi:hypothetical protein
MTANVGVIRSYVHRIGVVIPIEPALDNRDAEKRFFVVWPNQSPQSGEDFLRGFFVLKHECCYRRLPFIENKRTSSPNRPVPNFKLDQIQQEFLKFFIDDRADPVVRYVPEPNPRA